MRWARALRAHGSVSAIVLLVAVVTVAATTTGPTFATAARAAVLTDTFADAPVVADGLETVWQGGFDQVSGATATTERGRDLGGAGDLFPTLVRGQERTWTTTEGQSTVLAWRDGACEHLRISSGRCATAAGEVMVSGATARLDRMGVGDVLDPRAGLTVVGIYEPVDPTDVYWFNRGYFPQAGLQLATSEVVDALFTAPQTFAAFPDDVTGVTVVDLLLDLPSVAPDRVAGLRTTVAELERVVADQGGGVTTGIGDALDDADEAARALTVPVALVTLQLLVPVWILLFLSIGDAAEARAPLVALATLRGHSRLRTLAVGLAAPVALLLAALPIGVLAGWLATGALARAALRPGTPVALTPLAVLAAVGALSAGLLAATIAGVRAVRRPVLDQWRRSWTPGTRRGWVLDAAIAVATVAGAAELFAAGAIGSASTHVLALLVPGLIGLAMAVLAARLLPAACRRLFGVTARRGGLAPFLAVRQVARRPAGLRTVMMLATSFALVTFALAAWTVTRANVAAVAATAIGAATVLDVVPAPAEDLAATVDRLDRGGTAAMAVDVFSDLGNADRRTIAVDPARYARVAAWRDDFADRPLATLLPRLHPPAAAPVTLAGDRIRVRLAQVTRAVQLQAGLGLPTGYAETPLALGTATTRGGWLETALPTCPCQLRSLSVTPSPGPPDADAGDVLIGGLTVVDVQTRRAGHWQPVAAGLTVGSLWRSTSPPGAASSGLATPAPDGLRLTYVLSTKASAALVTWTANSWPAPLPALVSPDVAASSSPTADLLVGGLDGAQLAVTPVAVVTLPGAPDGGVVVDRTYARRAAFDESTTAAHQVWLASGAPDGFADRLRAAGVQVTGRHTAAQASAALLRSGPALATVLFVADAVAAAALACVGAVAALHLAARRRRYELTALAAAGCPRPTLLRSLWLEQLLVLGAGWAAGVAAGVLAVKVALPAVPEFVHPPLAPALRYDPAWAPLAAGLVALAVVTVAAGVIGASGLTARLRADQLREGTG